MAESKVPYSDPVRRVLVKNIDEDPIPPFALVESRGFHPATGLVLVGKCTLDNRNDMWVNGETPVAPGDEGQVSIDLFVTAGWENDGSGESEEGPQPGEEWGAKAGSWFLSKRRSGYRVAFAYDDPEQQKCLVTPMRVNLVEFVEVTACPDPDAAEGEPATYSAAKLVYFDPVEDEWLEPEEEIPVWYRDETGVPAGPVRSFSTPTGTTSGPCRVKSLYTGTGYGRPTYTGFAEGCRVCTTTSTTTTAGPPCPGECVWTGGFGMNWELDSSTCTGSCHCIAPNWCPDETSPTATTRTNCYGGPVHQIPAPCDPTATTTTGGPCTTTAGGDCAGRNCEWYCAPGYGWVLTNEGCPSSCPCPYPSAPCYGTSYCTTATTNCVSTGTSCSGGCRWIWDTADGGRWVRFGGGCFGVGVSNCQCDYPSSGGSDCGSETVTPCYVPCTPPCCPEGTSTTTTAGPPGCDGECTFKSDGFWWVITGTCGDDCRCHYPPYTPGSGDEIAVIPCGPTTTTTTAGPATTTTTSTTTTAGGVKYYCCEVYFCDVSNCDEDPDPCEYTGTGCYAFESSGTIGGCFVYFPNTRQLIKNCVETADLAACLASCTTTAGPCGGTCQWTCNGAGEEWVQTDFGCTGVGCPCNPVPEELPCNSFNNGQVFVYSCASQPTTTTTIGPVTTPGSEGGEG